MLDLLEMVRYYTTPQFCFSNHGHLRHDDMLKRLEDNLVYWKSRGEDVDNYVRLLSFTVPNAFFCPDYFLE